MSVTKQFILAGKAIFTLEIESGFGEQHGLKSHYTFRVNKSDDVRYGEKYFVGLLTGPDNLSDYSYLGVLDKEGFVRTTAKSVGVSPVVFKLLNRVIQLIWASDVSPIIKAGFKLHHEGRCGRCGRTLTTPESVTAGFGPECVTKI